jgi:hypothetical protein
MAILDQCLIIISILLIIVLIFQKKERLDVPIAGTVYPPMFNYRLRKAGTTPSYKDGMNDPAEKIDQPYYEGPYGDIILPSSMGLYDQSPDAEDYAGIYP